MRSLKGLECAADFAEKLAVVHADPQRSPNQFGRFAIDQLQAQRVFVIDADPFNEGVRLGILDASGFLYVFLGGDPSQAQANLLQRFVDHIALKHLVGAEKGGFGEG